MAVGPVFLECAVESLGLAVLPGRVRSGQDVLGIERRKDTLEVAGESVVHCVVGHHLANRDSVCGEERCGIGEERRAGRTLLIAQDSSEREPGVVIDRDVDVVEPELLRLDPTLVVIHRGGTIEAPTAAVGDPTEFLDIDVQQIAGAITFIPMLGAARGSNPDPGHGVELMQRRQPSASDDPRRRRCADTDPSREFVATEPFSGTQRDQSIGDLDRRRPWVRSSTRGSITEPGDAEEPESRHPAMSALPRDTELFRDVRHRPPQQNPLNKNQTTGLSQPRITVDHEKAFLRVTLDTTQNGGLFPTSGLLKVLVTLRVRPRMRSLWS